MLAEELRLGGVARRRFVRLRLWAATVVPSCCRRLPISPLSQAEGDIFFNGRHTSEFEHTRSVAYAGQMDNHEGNITVQETLDFAYLCTVREELACVACGGRAAGWALGRVCRGRWAWPASAR